MSATLYWQPIEPQFLMNSAGSVNAALKRAFGSILPLELDGKCLDILAGLEASWTGSDPNPYETIANAIVEHGRIRVWAEY